MAAKNRVFQVNELIKRELGSIILKKVEFPKNVLFTITRVETSSNLIQSKIHISVIPEVQTPKVIQILNQKIFIIQQDVNRRLRMRPVPKIKFAEDKEAKKANKVEELLERIKKI